MDNLFQLYKNNEGLAKNFVWRILQIGSKQGFSFLVLLIGVKVLSPYDFGIYNYIISAIFLLAAFGDFGISTATAKYVAEYPTKDKESVSTILTNAFLIVLSFALFIIILTLLFGSTLLGRNYEYLYYVLPLVILLPLSSLYDGLYRGMKRFKSLALISSFVSVISIVTAFFLIYQFQLKGALIAQISYYLVIVFYFLLRARPSFRQFDKGLIKKLFVYSSLVGLANIGGFLYTRADMLIMGYWGFTIETGYYGLINSVYMLSVFIFSILGTVIAPDIIRVGLIDKKWGLVRQKAIRFSIFSFCLGLIITALGYFVAPILIREFLSDYYNDAFLNMYYIFIMILPSAVVESTLTNGFITPLGHVGLITKIVIWGGIINVVLSLISLHFYGYIGVIITTVIVSILGNLIKIFLFFKILKEK